jgi:hypothetical protein
VEWRQGTTDPQHPRIIQASATQGGESARTLAAPTAKRRSDPALAHPSYTASWTQRDSAPSRARTFAQHASGFQALRDHLAAANLDPASTLLVLEATSTYWIALAVELHSAGYAIAVVNPRLVHSFAHSLPRRAKADPRDAQLLVLFGHDRAHAGALDPPPLVYHELRQRLTVRASLQQLRVQARNQLYSAFGRWYSWLWAGRIRSPQAHSESISNPYLSGKQSAVMRSAPHRIVHTTSTVHGSFPMICSLVLGLWVVWPIPLSRLSA